MPRFVYPWELSLFSVVISVMTFKRPPQSIQADISGSDLLADEDLLYLRKENDEQSEACPQRFGSATKKNRFHGWDIFAVGTSVVCLGLGIAAVASDWFSWRLGVDNNQLIALGILLSIMKLCLNRVAQYLSLVLEAIIGQSRLQNYDGLLRSEVFASDLSLLWRSFLVSWPYG